MSFFGLTRGTQIISCNSQIINSSITTSSIDMNSQVITSIGTPVNPNDSVPKNYIDNLIAIKIITLSGTNYTTILPNLSGDLTISIVSLVTNGPCGKFFICKADQNNNTAHSIRVNSSSGTTTLEKLQIRWLANTGIQLSKTGINYDGQYRIKYIEN